MGLNLPEGSTIELGRLNGQRLITIPHKKADASKYFIAAFLIVWLSGWLVGGGFAIAEVLTGEGGLFLIFWLGGWAWGVIFVGHTLYMKFRNSVPERLLLNKPSLAYDGGVAPHKNPSRNDSKKDQWATLFPRRRKFEFTRHEIQSLQLRETPERNRLTIDKGAKRVELASAASEVEREWLYDFLRKNYSLR